MKLTMSVLRIVGALVTAAVVLRPASGFLNTVPHQPVSRAVGRSIATARRAEGAEGDPLRPIRKALASLSLKDGELGGTNAGRAAAHAYAARLSPLPPAPPSPAPTLPTPPPPTTDHPSTPFAPPAEWRKKVTEASSVGDLSEFGEKKETEGAKKLLSLASEVGQDRHNTTIASAPPRPITSHPPPLHHTISAFTAIAIYTPSTPTPHPTQRRGRWSTRRRSARRRSSRRVARRSGP